MILPLALFIISGIVVISFLVHGRRALSHGTGLPIFDTISNFDQKITGTAEKIKSHAALVNKQNTFQVLNGAFVFVMRVLLAIVEWVRNHIHTLYEKARHEKPKLSGHGPSSLYLKQISEVKEEKKDL